MSSCHLAVQLIDFQSCCRDEWRPATVPAALSDLLQDCITGCQPGTLMSAHCSLWGNTSHINSSFVCLTAKNPGKRKLVRSQVVVCLWWQRDQWSCQTLEKREEPNEGSEGRCFLTRRCPTVVLDQLGQLGSLGQCHRPRSKPQNYPSVCFPSLLHLFFRSLVWHSCLVAKKGPRLQFIAGTHNPSEGLEFSIHATCMF